MFWIVSAFLLLIALAIILIPLFRYREDAEQDQSQSINVYKAQLKELDGDQKNDQLSKAEAVSARLEIERRLLKIAGNSEDKAEKTGTSTARPILIMVTVLVFLGSYGFYLLIGNPGMPDFPLDEQKNSAARMTKEDAKSPEMINEVAILKTYLAQKPDDIEAWRTLGQLETDLHNRPEAAKAFQRWHELDPNNIDSAVVYAESLIILSDGRVGPAALLVLNRARKIQPQNPGVRHYMALAEYQDGKVEQALAGWKALAADSKPGAPWLNALNRWIRKAEKELGLPSSIARGTGPALSAEQRATVADMSPAERAKMIKSMVARLQSKMDENPENIEGWFRLAKAYSVLGQKEDAIKAMEQAIKYAPDDQKPQIKKQLEILKKQE
ncbi:hypothetical protein MNBD_ALPHA02-2556 [hydrothermal vent metagenome]|uniref:Cytochrome c-type biogenesis protein H TPR domain-containing protein n=1 Tax=hydrothermal vent metagenome TaxID=652676 RepID=A0A3B0S902_9ZZZZ